MRYITAVGILVGTFGLGACGGSGTVVDRPVQGEIVGATGRSQAISSAAAPGTIAQAQGESFSGRELSFAVGTLSGIGGRSLFATDLTDIVALEGFNSFRDSTHNSIGVRGITRSGAGGALAFSVDNSRSPGGGIAYGYDIRRFGDAFVPDTGTVDYAGSYAGVYKFVSNDQPAGHLTGRAELTIDFGNGLTSGRIFDRRNTGVETLGDVTLNAGQMRDNGYFRATTDGGAFTNGNTSTVSGGYSGLVVGDRGQEVVGAIHLTHQLNGAARFNEVGVFTAVED